jgi:hypothetical protein
MYMRNTKKKSIKNSNRERKVRKTRRIKRRNRTRKNIGGSQEVYLTIQPTALGIRGEREWLKNEKENVERPVVPKLQSKVSIVNSPSIDIDEKIAEIIESRKNWADLVKPIHGKMMTSDIITGIYSRKKEQLNKI